ncbi:unnamed protein product [marine sediment metagenome]|uniref:Uncharacterized protein n=1 Tax=marine sediment metagenome TaxID=412755 RepID=X0S9S1_9ZZZZ
MGTNYSLKDDRNMCAHCGKGTEWLHIGKQSGGWVFSLHIYPEQGIHELKDWQHLFDNAFTSIEDEYGTVICTRDMVDRIEGKFNNRYNLENDELIPKLDHSNTDWSPRVARKSEVGEWWLFAFDFT